MKRWGVPIAGSLAIAMVLGGPVSATFPTVDVDEYRYFPRKETAMLGTTFTWHNLGSLAHTATQDRPLRFFTTGQIAPGATSTGVEFSSAGRFSYHCTNHPALMRGVMRVPVEASAGAIGLGEPVTITVSSDVTFKGHAFDLQRKRNHGDWVLARRGIGVSDVEITPKRTGEFRFRARVVEPTGAMSGWSPAASVIVGDV